MQDGIMLIVSPVNSKQKKYDKVIKRLKKDGWSASGIGLVHPDVRDTREARLKLWELGLLTTTKAYIEIVTVFTGVSEAG